VTLGKCKCKEEKKFRIAIGLLDLDWICQLMHDRTPPLQNQGIPLHEVEEVDEVVAGVLDRKTSRYKHVDASITQIP